MVSVILTTFAIDASDTLSGKGGTMLSSVINGVGEVCPEGMIELESALTFTCVDKYEVSAGEKCQFRSPSNQFDTEANLKDVDCDVVSKEGLLPWRNVTREQAAVMCVRSGKRLPSAAEWYQFSMGTPSDKCNIVGGDIAETGSFTECISAAGVKDVVGNAWEWVNDDVINGVYQGRELPESGYVRQVDSGGVATVTEADSVDLLFDEDYFWTDKEGAYAMIRGGFYGSKSDAGVYAIHAETAPTLSGKAVGFRCVK